ncbi:hypothetical protein ACF0H5_012062 [Mactra antiquata]
MLYNNTFRFLPIILLVLVLFVVPGQSRSTADDRPEVSIGSGSESSRSGNKKCDLGPEECDTPETGLVCMTFENGNQGNHKKLCKSPQKQGQSCDQNLVSSETCQTGLSCQSRKGKYVCLPAENEQFGPACDSEERNWKLMYHHDVNGNPLDNTNFENLKEVVRDGAEIKVWTSIFGLMNIQKTTVCEDESCVHGQSLFWVNKVKRGPYNSFFVFSTTGNVHLTQFFVGGHENEPRQNSNIGAPEMKWFARTTSAKVNDTSRLVRAVSDGASLKVATCNDSIFRHIEVTRVVNNEVEGLSIWDMKDILGGREFNTTEQRTLTHWSVNGRIQNTSWLVNLHEMVESKSMENFGIDWFADSCWSFAYRHSGQGLLLSGSKSRLLDAIVDGKGIKVKVGTNFYEANTVKVMDSGDIIAQVYDSIEDDVKQGNWKWMDVSASGEVKTYVVGLGGDSNIHMSTENVMVTWFIENREWQRVNDGDDMNLIMETAMNSGSDVRYSARFDDVTTWYQADVVSKRFGAFNEREVVCNGDQCQQRYSYAQWTSGNLEYMDFVVGTTEQVKFETTVPNPLNWYICP